MTNFLTGGARKPGSLSSWTLRATVCAVVLSAFGATAYAADLPGLEKRVIGIFEAHLDAMMNRDSEDMRTIVGDQMIFIRGGGFFDGFAASGEDYIKQDMADSHFYPLRADKTQNLAFIYGDVAVVSGRHRSWTSTKPAEVGKAGWRPQDVQPTNNGPGGADIALISKEKNGWRLVYYCSAGGALAPQAQENAEARARAQQNAAGGKEQALEARMIPRSTPLNVEGQQVLAAERARLDAYVARDWTKLRTMVDDDVTYLYKGKRLIGPDALVGNAQADKDLFTGYTVGEPVVVHMHNNAAVIAYAVELKVPGGVVPTYTTSMFIKAGSGWKFIGGTYKTARPLTSEEEHPMFAPPARR